MVISIGKNELYQMIMRQLENLLVFDRKTESDELREIMDRALVDLEACFSKLSHFYLWKDGVLVFHPFHTCQNAVLIYLMSRVALTKFNNQSLAERLYFLNKILHSIDIFYEVSLPSVWYCDHPLGSVMGRASYSDFFFFSQNCTVGGNYDRYPSFGEKVMLMAGVSIIGNCHIGGNTFFSTQTFVRDQDVPDDVVVFGRSPDLSFKDISKFDLDKFKVW